MVNGWMVLRHGPPSALSHQPSTHARIPHASFRIRMPRLRKAVRVPDARGPDAVVSRLPGRRATEAVVGFRCAVGQSCQIIQVDAARAVRIVRGSARGGGLSNSLIKNLEFGIWNSRHAVTQSNRVTTAITHSRFQI